VFPRSDISWLSSERDSCFFFPPIYKVSWERFDNQRQGDLQALKALRGSLGES